MNQAFENHIQWPAVKAACEKLNDAGFTTYLAGGCVRDLLMNRTPHDFDIATEATPEQVAELFPNSLLVGRQFGVSIIPYAGQTTAAGVEQSFQLEIATFRKDGEYKDGRHPEIVIFSDAQEDAERRDFTVNALFYDLASGQVIDHVSGKKDLEAKILRAVGEPERRFREDKLRLLRAVRFAAQLDFEIEAATWREVKNLAPEITVVSRERIRDELLKLLKVPARRSGLELLRASGLFEVLFPDLASTVVGTLGSTLGSGSASGLDSAPASALKSEFAWEKYGLIFSLSGASADSLSNELEDKPNLWFALFFSPTPRSEALSDLRIDNQSRDGITWTWTHYRAIQNPGSMELFERLKLLMSPWWKFATAFAQAIDSERVAPDFKRLWDEAQQLFERQGGVMGTKPAPWISGKDLQAVGLKPGVEMGKLLSEAFRHQVLGDWASRKDAELWLGAIGSKKL